MTSLHADEAFLEHYQFSHDPFAARVPGFRFYPAQRKPVLGQLHHLARYSQLLLVVAGPQGSGKTLLRQALVASTNKQAVQSVVVSARGAGDVAGILRQVAQGLGVQQADVPSILAHVAQLTLTGQEVYLLVDDAEQLADPALNTLFTLAVGADGARPHVFLFAQSDFLERLEQQADGEERFHAIELQPYDEEETRQYLAQRLDGAGQGIDLLTDEQIEEIYIGSGGWPGAINQVARDVLVEAMLAQRNAGVVAGKGLPKKHLLALAVVAVALGAAWLMQGESGSTPVVAVEKPIELIAQESSSAQVGASSAEAEAANARAQAQVEFSGTAQPLPLPLVGEAQPVIREPLAQASGMEDEQGATTTAPAMVEAPAPAPVVPTIASAPAQPATPMPEVKVPEVKAAPVPVPAPKPVVFKPVVTEKPAPVVAKTAASAGAGDWYAARPASGYALQILGTRSESSAKAFVGKHGAEYRYFKKLHQGQPLYVVTFGQFASRAAAQAAIKTLPADVQAGKPWPRSFASIQQEAIRVR
ncbi:AAA family ATPase [Pseudomonas sp. GOM6]|uniref:AAA family ATPase n=1 Tax=Pseudomonas sp. GOM6 TaxID=3036944 RepID=UPI00240943B6|nr:AAA family ATPase [Pseudomonas sp. GOM6]MDG1579875.1 SPOR domain-containing protein [Pseudomonas sp. GOM6]